MQDVDMVATGPFKGGTDVTRLYSCKAADTIGIPRDNDYAWPNTCEINGEEQTPCPVEIHLSSTLAIIFPE